MKLAYHETRRPGELQSRHLESVRQSSLLWQRMGQSRELWLQCVDWLASAGLLDPAAHRIEKAADLAALLRDGILLCELVSHLMPGCINRNEMFTQYQQNRKSTFIRCQNIALFLKACKQSFGLKELFGPNDLHDLDDFGRVLKVLSLLSHSQQAKSFNLRPFPDVLEERVFCDSENVYCNLREEVEACASSASEANQEENGAAAVSCEYDFIAKDEKIYDSIMAHKPTKPVSTKYADFKPSNEREFCLKELLDTETNYCNMVGMIVDKFYNKLSLKLKSEDVETIFMNIKILYEVHKKFLAKLTPAVLKSLDLDDGSLEKSNLTVYGVFKMFKMEFTQYAPYCSSLERSRTRIDELERMDSVFKQCIDELVNEMDENLFRLQHLLVVPMQRIMKYPLLLKELRKSSTSVEEQIELDDALEAIKDVITYINEVKRDYEAIQVIKKVQRSVSSCEALLDKPHQSFHELYGRLLLDGEVKLADNHDGSSRPKPRYVFLFEKMLMICKHRGALYEFKKAHAIAEYELLENELEVSPTKTNTISRKLTSSFFDNASITLFRRGGGGGNAAAAHNTMMVLLNATNGDGCISESNAISVPSTSGVGSGTTANRDDSSSIQITFKTTQQRIEWRKALKDAIEANNPPMSVARGHSVLYKTYRDPIHCSVCRKLLYGVFYQGYHCSGCNLNMHKTCCHLQNCSVPFALTGNAASATVSAAAVRCGGTASSRLRSNSSFNFHVPQFHVGDMVVCTHSVAPTADDPNRLSCASGELIELIEVTQNANDGSLTLVGRLSNFPTKTGKIPVDCIARTSDTLRRSTAERTRSCHSAGSLCEPIPDISQQHQRIPTLVSREIIKMCKTDDSTMDRFPWYFGELNRRQATDLLQRTENGTFLVRYSADHGHYAISLKYDSVKHMKIERCKETGRFFLHDAYLFNTIMELVNFYRENSLGEAFVNLDTVLCGTPLRSVTFRALQFYEGRDADRYLTFRKDDLVTVVDTFGERNGWWKGYVHGRPSTLGFFPITYVERVTTPTSLNSSEVDQQCQPISSYTFNGSGIREPRQLFTADSVAQRHNNNNTADTSNATASANLSSQIRSGGGARMPTLPPRSGSSGGICLTPAAGQLQTVQFSGRHSTPIGMQSSFSIASSLLSPSLGPSSSFGRRSFCDAAVQRPPPPSFTPQSPSVSNTNDENIYHLEKRPTAVGFDDCNAHSCRMNKLPPFTPAGSATADWASVIICQQLSTTIAGNRPLYNSSNNNNGCTTAICNNGDGCFNNHNRDEDFCDDAEQSHCGLNAAPSTADGAGTVVLPVRSGSNGETAL